MNQRIWISSIVALKAVSLASSYQAVFWSSQDLQSSCTRYCHSLLRMTIRIHLQETEHEADPLHLEPTNPSGILLSPIEWHHRRAFQYSTMSQQMPWVSSRSLSNSGYSDALMARFVRIWVVTDWRIPDRLCISPTVQAVRMRLPFSTSIEPFTVNSQPSRFQLTIAQTPIQGFVIVWSSACLILIRLNQLFNHEPSAHELQFPFSLHVCLCLN